MFLSPIYMKRMYNFFVIIKIFTVSYLKKFILVMCMTSKLVFRSALLRCVF